MAGIEIPPYRVLAMKDGIEVRQYFPVRWVSTTVESVSHERARNEGFMLLFEYISGKNAAGIKIAMTAPVITKVVQGGNPYTNSFTVSFYIPVKYQTRPIPPLARNVFIEQFPEMTVYVSKFGGFPSDDKFLDETRRLKARVGVDVVDTSSFYTAGYDSPAKLSNRTNEIWLLKK